MVNNVVPSLEGSLYLKDPLSIIGYIVRLYALTPADTVPILPDEIISLRWKIARFLGQPDTLCSHIQSDLQKVLSRVFGTDRVVNVSCSQMTDPDNPTQYIVSLAIMYTTNTGDKQQIGATIRLDNTTGEFVIPEDTLMNTGFTNLIGPT